MPPHSKKPSRSEGKRGSKGTEVSARQRALYALPVADFIRARDALAKELASQGQTKEAQATRKLKRPVIGAWLVNQLVHHHPEHIQELLSAARALEKAHRRAMSGLASAPLKEANRAFQRALDALMAEANALLSSTGRAASGDLIRQVDETLRAAALGTEEERTVLSQGMLTQPLHSSGFGSFSQLLLVGPSSGAHPKARPAEKPSKPPPARDAPELPSAGGKVLQGPWVPREQEKETPPRVRRPTKPPKRADSGAEARRAHEAKLEQHRREEQQREELLERRREARQRATEAEQDQRSAHREVTLAEAALKAAEAKTLRARRTLEFAETKVQRAREALKAAEAQALQARQAFELEEEAARQQTEAVSQATARAQSAEQALAQALRDLQEAGTRPSLGE